MPIPPFRPDGWLPSGHHLATWEEVVAVFGGRAGSRRRIVTERLLWLRDGLRRYGVRGSLLLDGSYVSAKEEPGDFDVMLIAEPGIDAMKAGKPSLAEMLDPIAAERKRLLYPVRANGFAGVASAPNHLGRGEGRHDGEGRRRGRAVIGSEAELREAWRRLTILEAGLDSLRGQLEAENPALLPVTSSGYVHQIRVLRESIAAYEGARASSGHSVSRAGHIARGCGARAIPYDPCHPRRGKASRAVKATRRANLSSRTCYAGFGPSDAGT